MKPTPANDSNHWRPLGLFLLLAGGVVAVGTRLIPYEYRLPNLALAGALFLYAGARVRPWPLLILPFAVMAGIDLYFLGAYRWSPSLWTYGSYALYLLLAAWLLRRSESPLRIGVVVLTGSVQFFLITNFGYWIQCAVNPEMFVGNSYYYPPTFAGLLQCYEMAIPFFRGTLMGDVVFSGMLFGAHALLTRAYFPAEKVSPCEE